MLKHVMPFVILALLVLAGCAQQPTETTKAESPYIGGSKGVVAHFEEMGILNEQSNVNEIFEGESFPIEVIVKNKGEHEIASGDVLVTLKGIALADFSGIVGNGVLTNDESIEKISNINPDGGETLLDFTQGAVDASYLVGLTGASYDVDVFAEVVYNYVTSASVPKVCFKEDLTDPTICEVDEIKEVFSAGAPLQVTKVTERRAGSGRISLDFEIENVGDGDVAVQGDEFHPRYNQLGFTVSDADLWSCRSGAGTTNARLDANGKARINCKLVDALEAGALYTKQVDLTLSYQYRDLIKEGVRIIKP